MTRIDFYVLDSPTTDRHDRMICRIVEKAWQQGHSVYIQCQDMASVKSFDQMLWRFKDTSFVPHAVDGSDLEDSPVAIGTHADAVSNPDVLVNLAIDVPGSVSRYLRVIESAGYNATSRTAARTRYRYYQDRGFPLNTHKLNL